jgi:hypothetical protein
VELGNIIVDTRDRGFHRVIGISDFKSHLEISTSRILKPEEIPDLNPGFATKIVVNIQ